MRRVMTILVGLAVVGLINLARVLMPTNALGLFLIAPGVRNLEGGPPWKARE